MEGRSGNRGRGDIWENGRHYDTNQRCDVLNQYYCFHCKTRLTSCCILMAYILSYLAMLLGIDPDPDNLGGQSSHGRPTRVNKSSQS